MPEERGLQEMKNDLAEGLTREVLGEVNGWRLAEPGILGLSTRPPRPGKSALRVGCQHSEAPRNYLAVY